ncbi:hypothetical protein C8R31_101627 [Nitrosospira sp. Nsp2]|uniref:hypothetical protein n=1 Tax=Nitrosospira sp. Nsp2 TaxID=136548 RepID=UPI000D309EED|nr:hypothetical protein [Nitrosospira sp. Nsp2]PTR17463.1 hypothetical protein C8R31_101627 [Nitrosospira sp. Nsp2]
MSKEDMDDYNEPAMELSWQSLKPQLDPKDWTAGEAFTYRGFFAWGWEARRQYGAPTPEFAPVAFVSYESHNGHTVRKAVLCSEGLELPNGTLLYTGTSAPPSELVNVIRAVYLDIQTTMYRLSSKTEEEVNRLFAELDKVKP